MKKVVLLLILLTFPFTMVMAKETKKSSKKKDTKVEDKFIIECDEGKYYVNDQIICRTSINSSYAYNKMSFKLDVGSELKIVDVRSNYEEKWNIKFKNQLVTSSTKGQLQNGLQEFGIILIDALDAGELPIKIKDIVLENTKTKDTRKLESVETKLKVISSDNELKEILINGKELNDFSSSKTIYNIDMKSDEEFKVEAFTRNEFATLDGVGEFKVNKNNQKTIVPIEVTSESGNVRIYTLIINNVDFKDDGINKNADSILLKNEKGDIILYNYSSDTYEYNIDLSSEIDKISISPSCDDKSLSFVKKYGNQDIDLKYGNNIVLVKVKDENDQELTYILNITRPLVNKSSNNYLGVLKIKGYELDFSKKIKNYKLPIKKGTDSLDITAEPEDSKSTISILGNNNLKKGSVIKITVTAENESKLVYNLNIDEFESSNKSLVILFLLLIVFIIIYVLYKKNTKKSNVKAAPISNKKEKTYDINIDNKLDIKEENKVVVNSKETNKQNNEPKTTTTKKKNNNNSKTTTNKNSAKKKTTSTTKSKGNTSNKSKQKTTKTNTQKSNAPKKTNNKSKSSTNKNTQNKKKASVKKK